MTTACVVQARMGSTRLPGKVLADLAGTPMLCFLLNRLARLPVEHVIVATSRERRDDPVADCAQAAGATVVRGSEQDVLDRFASVVELVPTDTVVRLGADCPLIDSTVVAAVIDRHRAGQFDYTTNILPRTFPRGLDVEVVETAALRDAAHEAVDPIEREHVTPFLMRRPERFRLGNLRAPSALGHERWTVDTADDLAFVRSAVEAVGNPSAGWQAILAVVGRRTSPSTAMSLRPADISDADRLRAWRNDPDAVRFSASARPVDPVEHDRWLRARLDDAGSRLWIGELRGRPCGHVRVDVTDGVGTVSLAVVRHLRRRGVGRALLDALITELSGDHQTRELRAVVHVENVASRRLFSSGGFTPAGERGRFLFMSRQRTCEPRG